MYEKINSTIKMKEINSQKDIDNGKKGAKVIILFTMDGCGHCTLAKKYCAQLTGIEIFECKSCVAEKGKVLFGEKRPPGYPIFCFYKNGSFKETIMGFDEEEIDNKIKELFS
jgi:hypothetical protein